MKIVILEGSPSKNGSSNLLAEQFRKGASEAGHNIQIIDAAHANIPRASAVSIAGMKDHA